MSLRVWVIAGALALGQVAVPGAAAQDQPASQPAKVTPVDFRKLKELMPAELAGVKRSGNEGEKTSLGEFSFSRAEAAYEKPEPGEKDPNVRVEIVDYGAAQGMAAAFTMWETLDVDRESDEGHEKSIKVKGQPGMETFTKEGQSGNVQLYVAKRFYVNVTTNNVPAEELKELVESLPIEKLAELK